MSRSVVVVLLVGFAFMGREYGLEHTTPPPVELREADPQLCVWITNQPPPAEELESTWALSQET